jgi:hypothetical protein
MLRCSLDSLPVFLLEVLYGNETVRAGVQGIDEIRSLNLVPKSEQGNDIAAGKYTSEPDCIQLVHFSPKLFITVGGDCACEKSLKVDRTKGGKRKGWWGPRKGGWLLAGGDHNTGAGYAPVACPRG